MLSRFLCDILSQSELTTLHYTRMGEAQPYLIIFGASPMASVPLQRTPSQSVMTVSNESKKDRISVELNSEICRTLLSVILNFVAAAAAIPSNRTCWLLGSFVKAEIE